MIGLTFLAIGLLWLALSVFLAIKLPKWFGASKPVWRGLLGGITFVILMVGPFVDHVVGMQQFERLCGERTAVQVTSAAASVEKAKRTYSDKVILRGYLISIYSVTATYIDLKTNEVFLSYDHLSTRGGRVAGIALMGGWHSCSAEKVSHKDHQKLRQIPTYQKIVNGDSKE